MQKPRTRTPIAACLLASLLTVLAGGCPQGIEAGADEFDLIPGPQGERGQPGEPGQPGLNCWDVNGNGVADPNEDVNLDGAFDARDCRGEDGGDGRNGLDGEAGASPFELIGDDAVFSQGRVGIGTDQPAELLHVAAMGLARMLVQTLDDTIASVRWGGQSAADSAEIWLDVPGSSFNIKAIGNTSRLRLLGANNGGVTIDVDGNVGVGTESPAARLHVVQSDIGDAVIVPGLRTEQTDTSPNVIGGGADNSVADGVVGAAIAGGGMPDDNGSGPNRIESSFGAIGGGFDNRAGLRAFVGGGQSNTANSIRSVIGGGSNNTIDQFGDAATIGGGRSNAATRTGTTIAGGQFNNAAADDVAIGGGNGNAAFDRRGTIGGGANNRAGVDDGDVNNQTFATVGGGSGNTAGGPFATVGGGSGNTASGSQASTVAGGFSNDASGSLATIGGGFANDATGTAATLCGGQINEASGFESFIGGGQDNAAGGQRAIIVGGQLNVASGNFAVIGGGQANEVSGLAGFVGAGQRNECAGSRSAILGGEDNRITGGLGAILAGDDCEVLAERGIAMGRRVKISNAHPGAILFADNTQEDFNSASFNEFAVRATGGVRMVTAVDSNGAPTAGARLSAGSGTWTSLSDRNAKEHFELVDPEAVLEKLAEIEISTWNYKTQDDSIRHMGPMAQDFFASFAIGEDERHITTVDADGVALAAIQGLERRLKEKDKRIAELERRIERLEGRFQRLEPLMGQGD